MTGRPPALGSLLVFCASNCLWSHEPWAEFSLPVFAQCFAPIRFPSFFRLDGNEVIDINVMSWTLSPRKKKYSMVIFKNHSKNKNSIVDVPEWQADGSEHRHQGTNKKMQQCFFSPSIFVILKNK
jgi:hypothetical protein